jgi:hypothetical protein
MKASSLILAFLLFSVSAVAAHSGAPFVVIGSECQLKWKGETERKIAECMDDYRAILAGESPKHASSDKARPVPADGGTSYWIGDGYRITIMQSICHVGGVQGFMYGPVIELDRSLAVGNSNVISAVSFYTLDAWRSLKSKESR